MIMNQIEPVISTLQSTNMDIRTNQHLPSGKRLHNYGKSLCLMGKSTNGHLPVRKLWVITRGFLWVCPEPQPRQATHHQHHHHQHHHHQQHHHHHHLIIIISIIIISIIIIKPLLKIFNECRSLTGVGELNPYWRSSMNVEVYIVDLPNSCNNIWLGMGNLYAATPRQSPGVARCRGFLWISMLV